MNELTTLERLKQYNEDSKGVISNLLSQINDCMAHAARDAKRRYHNTIGLHYRDHDFVCYLAARPLGASVLSTVFIQQRIISK